MMDGGPRGGGDGATCGGPVVNRAMFAEARLRSPSMEIRGNSKPVR